MKNITLLLIIILLSNSKTISYAQNWSSVGVIDQLLEPNGKVNAMVKDQAGNIYVAGEFTDGDFSSNGNYYVAKWDGIHWTRLQDNDTIINDNVYSLCFDQAGNLYAAGALHTNASAFSFYDERYVAKWDGTSWSIVGGANHLQGDADVLSICADSSGNIYAGGQFRNAINNYYVAKYDGTSWSELGGTNTTWGNGFIYSLCSDANGAIYAAGNFFNIITSKYVAKFNGTNWSELGGLNGLGANSDIYSICMDYAGNLFAGGRFTDANGIPYVAKYNGSNWSNLGSFNIFQVNFRTISQVICDTSNHVFAVGHFNQLNTDRYYVAKWDGINTWNTVSDTIFSQYVSTSIICPKGNGEVYGIVETGNTSFDRRHFVESTPANNWTQNITITQLEVPYNNSILTSCKDQSGALYVAGSMPNFINGEYLHCVQKWDGNAWSVLGGYPNGYISNQVIHSICSDASGNIYAETIKPGTSIHAVAKWDGNSWTYLGDLNYVIDIYTMCSDIAGNIFAAGNMTWPGVVNNCVLMFDGTYWTPVGGFAAQLQASGPIKQITTDNLGNLYVVGVFNNASLNPYVAKWNGNNWSELGGTNSIAPYYELTAVHADANNNIYAGGVLGSTFVPGISKWNGTSWSQLNGLTAFGYGSTANSAVQSITSDNAGNVYTCGIFTNIAGSYCVPVWNGSSWTESGGINNLKANDSPISLISDGNAIYASGDFTTPIKKRKYMAKFGCGSLSGSASIMITAVAPTICEGSSAIFNASFSNVGTNPTYQWFVNGIPVNGTNNSSITIDSLQNNDIVYCVLNSSDLCLATAIDTSNSIQLSVVTPIIPTLTFNGTELSANVNATYILEWQFNGVSIPNTSNLSNYTPTQNGMYTVVTIDPFGCGAVSQPYNVVISGVTFDQENENSFELIPNPAYDKLRVLIKSDQSLVYIEIIDLKGNVLISQTSEAQLLNLDLKQIPSGLYFVTMRSNELLCTKKLVKI